ncbi:MAG: cytochrome c4 [Xanthomonadaceae bacterium]|nr:cytochrome c4 [Xanthomonadaceae bacterium]MDE1961741.1 cytochrome c4 [Xanthomonadaceae bacterium]MDE2085069.1 cytochrome c4 [Xanthomonadaceae bacterium]MDE2257375.1 cytochrome c4 [Xanthomonadaceae bacterium]
MSFRLVIALSALLGAGSIQAQAPATAPAAPEAPLKPGDASAGQAKTATCAACHGIDGNSAAAQYPKLAGQQASYIVRQLELFKSGKRANPIMLGFAASLSEQDMRDIGAYFASKTSLPGVADAKLVPVGEAYYRSGDAKDGVPACMACHGPDGRGNPGSEYPQLSGQHADYVAARLKAYRDGSAGSDDHARIMEAIAKPLNDAEIAALASYVEGLHAVDAPTAAQ